MGDTREGAERLRAAVEAFFGDGHHRGRRGGRAAENAALLSECEAALGVRFDRRRDGRYGLADRGALAFDPAGSPLPPPRFSGAAEEEAALGRLGGLRHDLFLDLSDVAPCARLTGNSRRLEGGRVTPAFFLAAAAPEAVRPWIERLRALLAARGVALPDEETLALPAGPYPDFPELPDTPGDLLAHLFGEA